MNTYSCVPFNERVLSMKIRQYFDLAIKETRGKLDDFLFKCYYRQSSKDFSRESKMGFKQTVLFMMNMVKKSIQLELNGFIEAILKKDFSISKQAYGKARQNIKPEIFVDLSNSIVNGLYEKCDDYKVWNGYRLSAIDGSSLEIPNTEELRKEFGYSENNSSKLARARASCIYDVLNRLVIKSKIDRFDVCEREVAKELILKIVEDGTKHDLILFDRGYPSTEFIAFLIENGIDYVMRSKRNFSNQVKNANNEDQIIKIKYGQKYYDTRVVRFQLESGEEEILLTNLLDKKLTIKDFKRLYFMRWGIEIKYDDLKNKIQIENFTGTSKVAIEQDFYASIYLANMAELARIQNEEILREKNCGKELKYEYKTNINLLIGSLKDRLVMMLLENSPRKRKRIYKKLMNEIAKNSVPIRPDRHNPRKDSLVASKYRLNQKRCL